MTSESLVSKRHVDANHAQRNDDHPQEDAQSRPQGHPLDVFRVGNGNANASCDQHERTTKDDQCHGWDISRIEKKVGSSVDWRGPQYVLPLVRASNMLSIYSTTPPFMGHPPTGNLPTTAQKKATVPEKPERQLENPTSGWKSRVFILTTVE